MYLYFEDQNTYLGKDSYLFIFFERESKNKIEIIKTGGFIQQNPKYLKLNQTLYEEESRRIYHNFWQKEYKFS